MTRVLRFPRLSAASCIAAIICAAARDLCVAQGLGSWALVLLFAVFLLLAACLVLISCRFFVDAHGVGVGFLLRVRRVDWDDISALGILCCNTRRPYFYGMYRGHTDFLHLLHSAPRCGYWGFVVPASRKLIRAMASHCPFEIDLSPIRHERPAGRMRTLWQQPAGHILMLLPITLSTLITCALMILRGGGSSITWAVGVDTAIAFFLLIAGLWLLQRIEVSALTCPRVSESGVAAGRGIYLPWSMVRLGYVHRVGRMSGMFMLSQPLSVIAGRGCPPLYCLSMPDVRSLVLAYVTYCPHAPQQFDVHGTYRT